MSHHIYRELSCEFQYHRNDFETCPHCNHKYSTKTWERAAIDLILDPVSCVSDRLAIVSECPGCFEKSWVHENFSSITYGSEDRKYPKSWAKAAEDEDKARKLQALRDWGKGLCWHCNKLEEGTVERHAWRHCSVGSGPPETKCGSFDEL